MKKSFVKVLSMALVATAFIACNREQFTESPAGEESNSPKTISTVIDAENVKTTIDVDGASAKVLWSKGDQISVSSEGVTNVYELDGDGGAESGDFNWVSGNTLPAGSLVAYFPQTITPANMVWPSDQTYKEEVGAPMIATLAEYDGKAIENLTFTNLGAILRLNLKTSKESIKVATITVAADQPLSGAFTVSENAAVISEGNGKVTLNCGEGVEIGTSDSYFNLAVPANAADAKYTNVVITVVTTEGLTCDKHVASLGKTLARNNVYNIAMTMNDFAKYEGPVSANMAKNSVAIKWQNEDDVKALDEVTYEALVYWEGEKGVSGNDGRIQTLMGNEGGFLLRSFTSLSDWEKNNGEAPAGWRVARPSVDNLTFGKKNDDGSYQNLTVNAWHHVCYTHRSGMDCVYIDGILVASDSKSSAKVDLTKGASDKPETKGFHIGLSYNDERWFSGKVAEVRVWTRALAANELTYAHRLSVDPATATGLLGYWKFDEGEGQYVQDYSGNGNYGTFASTASWNGTGVGPYTPDHITLDPESLALAAAGETKDVTVTCSPSTYSVTIPAEATWLSYSIEGATTHITAEANEGESRTAEVKFTCGFAETVLTVEQGSANMPLSLESGKAIVLIANQTSKTEASAGSYQETPGATVEWGIKDYGQTWTASVTPSTGVTLTPDVENHTLTLEVSKAGCEWACNIWTVTVAKEGDEVNDPLILLVYQQLYSKGTSEMKGFGFESYDVTSQSDITAGTYQICDRQEWNWNFLFASLDAQALCISKYTGDGNDSHAMDDYLGVATLQHCDYDADCVHGSRVDACFDFVASGDGFNVHPYGCHEYGLTVVDGHLAFTREGKNVVWGAQFVGSAKKSNACRMYATVGGTKYWMKPQGSGNNKESAFEAITVVTTQPDVSSEWIELYKVRTAEPASISLSATSKEVEAAGGTFDITVTSHPAEYTVAIPEEATWLTYEVDGEDATKVHFTVEENTGAIRTAVVTFTAGDASATLTVNQSSPSAPLALESGSDRIFIGAHGTETTVKGGTFEWGILDNGQAWTATVTPSDGVTLTPGDHKVTLTIPDNVPVRTGYNMYTVKVAKTVDDGSDPLIMTVLQQLYNKDLYKNSNIGYVATALKQTSDIVSGDFYRLFAHNSWTFEWLWTNEDGQCWKNEVVDNSEDYFESNVKEDLDGNADAFHTKVMAIRLDGMFEFVSAGGDNNYYIYQAGTRQRGLTVVNDNGTNKINVNYAGRNTVWNITGSSYKWTIKTTIGGSTYYLKTNTNSSASNPVRAIEVSTSSSSSVEIVRAATTFINLSKTSASVKAINDSFDVTVDCLPAEFTIDNPASSWLTASTSGNTVTFKKTAEPAEYGDYTITFTAGTKTATLTVTAVDPSAVLTPDCNSRAFYPVTWDSSIATQEEFTFETWIKTAHRDSKNQSIMGIEGVCLFRIEDDKLEVSGPCSSKPQYTVNNTNFYGNWHHIAAVFSKTAGKVTLYVDGTSVASGSLKVNSVNLNGTSESCNNGLKKNFYINAAYEYGRNVNGSIAYMRVWKKALTASEIATNMTVVGIEDDDLIADWRFNESEGNTVTNHASTGSTYNLKPKNWSSSSSSSYSDSEIVWTDNGKPFTPTTE